MGRDKDSITKYWQELAKQRGLNDQLTNTVLEVLKDDAAAKAFVEGFVPQSDYSRDLDKTRDEWKTKADQATQKVAEYDKWYNDNAKPAYETNLKVAAKLKQYEDTFGAIGDPQNGETKMPPDVITKKDFEEHMARLSQNTAKVMKDLTSVALDHFKRFGENLDVDGLEKFAVENNLAIRQAYDSMIQPKVQERQNAEWEAKVKAARDEGARDALSRHKLPLDSKPKEAHPFFDRKEASKDMSEFERRDVGLAAFTEAWNSAGTTNQ